MKTVDADLDAAAEKWAMDHAHHDGLKKEAFKAGFNRASEEIRDLRAALELILHEGNMATMGKWDATERMKAIAYNALARDGG